MKKLLLVMALLAGFMVGNAQDSKPMHEKDKMHTKMKIKEADLPQAIKDNMAADFAGATFKEAEKVDKKDGAVYEVEVMMDKTSWKLFYDKDGKFIKKMEKKMKEKKMMKGEKMEK